MNVLIDRDSDECDCAQCTVTWDLQITITSGDMLSPIKYMWPNFITSANTRYWSGNND